MARSGEASCQRTRLSCELANRCPTVRMGGFHPGSWPWGSSVKEPVEEAVRVPLVQATVPPALLAMEREKHHPEHTKWIVPPDQ